MQRISARLSSPRTLIALGLVIIFLSLAAMATRVYVRARDLQARISSIEALAQAGGNVDVKQIRNDLSAARNDLADIHSDAGWLLPVAPLLGWLPQIGG